ncbi:MAG TPA: pyruvate:ferredoxin (flavodoxin) oxidoreductase, partial [Polyangiaceae bacterium]
MTTAILDANEAVASVAYRLNEVLAIYPITPASPMGEWCDEWAVRGRKNLWGQVPIIAEMQSEGGAIGAIHGALTAGALGTTFTASQGLLLMIPNLYKIAGELTPFVLHVAARTVATHALSIFCDHSDVMACRQTGFALLASGTVQEAQDFAAIAEAATLGSRVPFLHFFDGFRTSHEITDVAPLPDDVLRELAEPRLIEAHRERGLGPDHPSIRGTAQNPDVFFQAREAQNPCYEACPGVVSRVMQRFFELTGRRYAPLVYTGHPEARHVIVAMGSGAVCAEQTARYLAARGERVGVVRVALYRPFASADFVLTLPKTVEGVAVLDRTKEPGAVGEPLYLDVVAALVEQGRAPLPRIVGGRYGLSSKEFTPSMVRAVFEELARPEPKRHFSVGIVDDVGGQSLPLGPSLEILPDGTYQAMFYGLGSDGTVGANKNSIKIIGEVTGQHVQAYFVYDSKKAGAVTVSHLRFGAEPIHAPYLIGNADFVGCHQFDFVERIDVLERARHGAVFLLNSPFPAQDVWEHLPLELQRRIRELSVRLFVIDAYRVAREAGLGRRINTVMQTCFFAISGVVPEQAAPAEIKRAIESSYGKKGGEIVRRNLDAVDRTLEFLQEVPVPDHERGAPRPPPVSAAAPEFVQRVTAAMIAGKGDLLPVSAFAPDGTWPTGTAQWEKRNLATEIPVWDQGVCIQCNKCALFCPHAAIRAKVYDPAELDRAPAGFQSMTWKAADFRGKAYTIQVAPEDCTGCQLCVEVCPGRDKANPRHKALRMEPARERRDAERERYAFFLSLPDPEREKVHLDVKGSQLLRPLFEYSGACPGCGETPYIKLLTQLFGDRMLVANATGCSSIYGGNLPTTPYTTDENGRGPSWSNSLFEDNAEF